MFTGTGLRPARRRLSASRASARTATSRPPPARSAQNNEDLYLILPLTRYNAFARGNYEINDWVGVFGQALFSHVTTYTRNEPGPITTGWDVFVPYGPALRRQPGLYTGNPRHGNPSAVISTASSLNGARTWTTPNLTDNPYNPAAARVRA